MTRIPGEDRSIEEMGMHIEDFSITDLDIEDLQTAKDTTQSVLHKGATRFSVDETHHLGVQVAAVMEHDAMSFPKYTRTQVIDKAAPDGPLAAFAAHANTADWGAFLTRFIR